MKLDRAQLPDLRGEVGATEAAEHHHGGLGPHREDRRQGLETVHPGHGDVEEHERRLVPDHERDGLLAVSGLALDVEQPRGLEPHAHQGPHVDGVVDEHHGDLAGLNHSVFLHLLPRPLSSDPPPCVAGRPWVPFPRSPSRMHGRGRDDAGPVSPRGRSRGWARASARPRRASSPCARRSRRPGRGRAGRPRSTATAGGRSTSRDTDAPGHIAIDSVSSMPVCASTSRSSQRVCFSVCSGQAG